MNSLLHELSANEIQDCIGQLERALDNHAAWLGKINEALICHLPPRPEDLVVDSHHHCQFGQWYHNLQHPVLSQSDEFVLIGEIHHQMHAKARKILIKSGLGEDIDHEEYIDLNDQVSVLRKLISSLGVSFTREISLVSKFADKIFEHASEGVMISDPRSNIINVNKAFTLVTGYSHDEVIGKSASLLNSGRQDATFYRTMWQALTETGHWQGEIWNRRKNGEIYLEWLSITAVKNNHNHTTHYVAIFSDITTIKANEERLHRLAYYDALTELPNRILFNDRLNQAIARASRNNQMVAVMLLDLDRFKIINDTLGHLAGDTLLTDVARRIGNCMRESDTVARLGGDEFIVVLPDLDNINHATLVAQKIIDILSHPFTLENQEVFITASIGISFYPSSGDNAEMLVKTADIAMYHAKEQGRNNYQFYRSSASDETSALFALEHSLRRALERNELSLHYQPQIDIETNAITGMEALLRWQHPERGMIPPLEFIPLAEETGLIIPIGEWVLRSACAQNKEWQDAGLPPVRIAVNLSVRQLKQKNLVARIEEILAETGLDPQWLELELTESMIMNNSENSIQQLTEIKALGIELAIDDFGTGYSSLSYLKRFPIDRVKIDQSFVQGVCCDPDDAAISQAIIALATILKLKVTAEGVETQDQLSFLREHQCCDAQGYLFSRPLPVEAMTRMLQQTLSRKHAISGGQS
jgi:diguanylate cyclase (GGDEF)-like protein/PAS domain S-box-containing protein